MSNTSNAFSENEYGYTTGVYAAAAAKAAARLLVFRSKSSFVDVMLPGGLKTAPIAVKAALSGDAAIATAVKSSPETADVTNGLEIKAIVRCAGSGVKVKAGEGIGIVTKPGLQLAPGKPAINPSPLKLITGEILQIVKDSSVNGIEVTLSVPDGELAARRTFNERLGIIGGISILGTTGILKPMSHESLRISLLKQVDVAAAEGKTRLVIVPGNMGESVAKTRLSAKDTPILQANNLFGDMLQRCREHSISSVLLLGHIGKLAKLAAGRMNTHSRFNNAAKEALLSAAQDGSQDIINKVTGSVTMDEAGTILIEERPEILDRLAKECAVQCQEFLGDKIKVSIALTLLDGRIAGKYISDEVWENDVCFT